MTIPRPVSTFALASNPSEPQPRRIPHNSSFIRPHPSLIFEEMSERTISDVLTKPDMALEMTLRPSLFSEFTGQAKVKERLEITVTAAKQRGEPIDHLLL